MAGILFVYSRSSIAAAKRNAQRYREADGGQISWRNETLRRHGALEKPTNQDPVHQLMRGAKDKIADAAGKGDHTREGEENIKARKSRWRHLD